MFLCVCFSEAWENVEPAGAPRRLFIIKGNGNSSSRCINDISFAGERCCVVTEYNTIGSCL